MTFNEWWEANWRDMFMFYEEEVPSKEDAKKAWDAGWNAGLAEQSERLAAAKKVINALRSADDASVLDAYEDYDDVVSGRVQVNAFQAVRAAAGKALLDALQEYDAGEGEG